MQDTINVLVACKSDKDTKCILDSLSDHSTFNIVGMEKDETGAIMRSAALKPDVLIIDMLTPGIEEPELAPIIRRRSPDTAIAVICENDDKNYAGRAVKAGITGILQKGADMDKLAPIVQIISSGGYYFSAAITNHVFSGIAFPYEPSNSTQIYKTNYNFFSPAERDIVTCVAHGLTDQEIADYLHFSIGTIRNYMITIKRKTKTKNRNQIVIYSLTYGLINFDPAEFRSRFPEPEMID